MLYLCYICIQKCLFKFKARNNLKSKYSNKKLHKSHKSHKSKRRHSSISFQNFKEWKESEMDVYQKEILQQFQHVSHSKSALKLRMEK